MGLVQQFKLDWIDLAREPQCKSNPAYPDGVVVDLSSGDRPACEAVLPYPARRCGLYAIHCRWCKKTVAVTTAGRPDDPKLVRIACGR